MFIITSEYLKPLEVVDSFIRAHREFLDIYFKKGMFIAAGGQIPRTGGVIIAKSSSKIEIETIMNEDPFVRNKIARYSFLEFNPVKIAEGYEEIFL